MANKIETSSKNIKPRINLNHNIYMTTSWCKYWEEGMNWPQLYYAFMKPLVAGIICMIKHERDKTSDSKTLHFVDLQKNKL